MVRNNAPMPLRYLLAISIALMPMLPAFASGVPGAGDHAAHANHGGMPANADDGTPVSGKHAHCNGHCCLACGMSFIEIAVVSAGVASMRPIQVPTVVRLHPHELITVPHRPPRTLS